MANNIIAGFPDIWLFLIIFVLGIIIYIFIPPETKKAVQRFVSRYFIFIFLILLLIYGWNKWGFVREYEWIAGMRYALFIVLFIAILYFGIHNMLYEHRYNTAYFTCFGAYGSCYVHYDIGRYTVWYLGTSGKSGWKGFVIPWGFAQKVVVTPKVSWDYKGDCMESITQVFKTDIKQLPIKPRHRVEDDARTYFARTNEEIYFGLFSEKLRTDDPTINDIEQEYKDVMSAYDKLEEEFDNVTGNTERYAGHNRRMRKMYTEDNQRPTRREVPPEE